VAKFSCSVVCLFCSCAWLLDQVEGKVLAADETFLQAGSADDPQLLIQLAV